MCGPPQGVYNIFFKALDEDELFVAAWGRVAIFETDESNELLLIWRCGTGRGFSWPL